jgi:peroxiredoxin
VRSFQKGFFSIGNYGTEVYLAPFDTLFIIADLSGGKGWRVKEWKGKYTFASQYYAARNQQLGNLHPKRVKAANFSPDLKSYGQQMDSLLALEMSFFENYLLDHHLPAWFTETERNEIRYADAYLRLNTVKYRDYLGMGKQEEVPAEYYAFIAPQLVNNSKASHLFYYQMFLVEYFSIQLAQQHGKDKADMVLSPQLAQQHLTGEAKDMYLVCYINDFWSLFPAEGEKELAKYYHHFANKALIDQVKAYYQRVYPLKTGDQAPAFYLKDEADSLISLEKLRGNVVYVGFWFVGCAPCIAEIPYGNALVEKFKDKKVKIFSICVRSSRENWAKMSTRFNLKTINLFANPNWEKSLIEQYNVGSYPHYVLIDQQSKIVANGCSRPSQDAAEKIRQLL